MLVSKDPSFSNVDRLRASRAFPLTRRASAARRKTYDDETTSYYWVVLPATGTNGSGAPGNPLPGAPADFREAIDSTGTDRPRCRHELPSQPTLRWSPTLGAKDYHLQVATEPTFASPLDDVRTASTEYTALKTYPAAKTLYWRVQADVENPTSTGKGLTWSDWGTFQIDLPKPVLDPATPTIGDSSLPVLRWFPVDGAVSYSLRIHEPNDNTPNTYTGFPSTAASFSKITGTGIFTWEIRADFPKRPRVPPPGPGLIPPTSPTRSRSQRTRCRAPARTAS